MKKLDNFFKPEAIAIIGASREKKKVGYEVTSNIINSNYNGKIFPINPSASYILEKQCFPSVLKIEEKIDLAIIITKNTIVPLVLEECGKKGIKNAIIISSGFKEIGIPGVTLENRIKRIALEYKIRVIGPNCLGLIDTYTPLNASFSSIFPKKGRISFISQSGALCTAILDCMKEEIGFSKFISFGNGCDVDEIELIEYLSDDENTDVIALYIEGTKDGRKFMDVTKNSKKPIILYKSGKTEQGKRAIASHTGSLAGNERVWDAVISFSSIIKADSIERLFSLAHSFASSTKPRGRKMVVVTNAGGPGIITSDELVASSLSLASLPPSCVNILKENLPLSSSVYNPIDILGDANASRYDFVLKTIIESNPDGIIVILTPQAMTEIKETADVIIKYKDKAPIFPVFMGGDKIKPAIRLFRKNGIINYSFPEDCINFLSSFLNKKEPHIHKELPKFNVKKEDVLFIFSKAKKEKRSQLTEIEGYKVMESYGIPCPKSFLLKNIQEIENVNFYPVVAKIASADILHKSDIGGVIRGIKTKDELRIAYLEIIENVKRYRSDARIDGVLVSTEKENGKELIIGLNRDFQFGNILMVGLGGIYVEVLKDVSFGIIPLCSDCCYDMLFKLKSYPILTGVRKREKIDLESIISVMLKVSSLSLDFKEIVSLDINPLRVYNNGCCALDCKIILD